MSLAVTTLFVGIFALFQIMLTISVIRRRFRAGVSLLDGGDEMLRRRIRAHGNFTETVPITLLAMAACELSGLSVWALLPGGISLLTGRVLHALAVSKAGPLNMRVMGMALTFVPMAGFGGWALVQGIMTL